jgi:hypothetical protein
VGKVSNAPLFPGANELPRQAQDKCKRNSSEGTAVLRSGPLHPTNATLTASADGSLAMAVPGLTFAIVEIQAPS